ncbi:hypothetical protein [Nonomuraea dietziae]|uniref:hypothetical protein n=1 Tax=Nonomuraea dietziae TaxID=65515 RepID=UPI0031E45645
MNSRREGRPGAGEKSSGRSISCSVPPSTCISPSGGTNAPRRSSRSEAEGWVSRKRTAKART